MYDQDFQVKKKRGWKDNWRDFGVPNADQVYNKTGITDTISPTLKVGW